MARDFDGSADYLYATASPLTAYGGTMACWFRADDITFGTADKYLMGLADTSVTTRYAALYIIDSSSKIAAAVNNGGTIRSWAGPVVSTGAWAHAAATFTSSASLAAFLDADSTGSYAVANSPSWPTGLGSVSLGCLLRTSAVAFFDGRIAEPAIWDAVLSQDELALLAAGCSPLLVRPQNLVYYAPLHGRAGAAGNEEAWVGSALTQVSSPGLADHPRIIYPRSRGITVPAASAGSHAATGSLIAQSATVAGTAADVATYTSTGALTAQAATVAGTATHLTLHASTGALAAQAAVVAGTAEHTAPGAFDATGALTAQAATVAGTAAHLTLHAATGALVADAASVSGVAVHSGPGAVVATRNTGAGKSRRSRQRYVLTIDGRDLIVSSSEEAQALIDEVKQRAEAAAQTALDRANASKRRPVGKVLRDARKALELPTIEAPPEVADYAAKVMREIRERYESQLRDIEITALLHKQQQQEEDDEDILLLIA